MYITSNSVDECLAAIPVELREDALRDMEQMLYGGLDNYTFEQACHIAEMAVLLGGEPAPITWVKIEKLPWGEWKSTFSPNYRAYNQIQFESYIYEGWDTGKKFTWEKEPPMWVKNALGVSRKISWFERLYNYLFK